MKDGRSLPVHVAELLCAREEPGRAIIWKRDKLVVATRNTRSHR